MTDYGAYHLRETTGTTGLETAARVTVECLADHEIPHLIVGGFAVQELGYPRVTVDVDIVVPDVLDAVEALSADLSGPFVREPGVEDTLKHQATGVLINFLPAGKVLKLGCHVPFPDPTQVSNRPQIVTLEELISLKLDSWVNSPIKRLKDKADVVELIIRRRLPRDLKVRLAVLSLYEETWDALRAES